MSDPQNSHICCPEKPHVLFCYCSELRNQKVLNPAGEGKKRVREDQQKATQKDGQRMRPGKAFSECKTLQTSICFGALSKHFLQHVGVLENSTSDPDWSECRAGNSPISAHPGTSQYRNPGVRSSYPLTPHKVLQQPIYLGNQNPALTIQNLAVKVSICDI